MPVLSFEHLGRSPPWRGTGTADHQAVGSMIVALALDLRHEDDVTCTARGDRRLPE
jgi:hypothetical protein